jgi:uncharacterized protein (DUF983 family)
MSTTPSTRRRSFLWALLRQRCPRCREGRMFAGSFRMNDPCRVCGRLFQREEGYFLGAMYFSYALATAVLLPLYLVVMLLLPGQDTWVIALVATALYLPFVPVVFRYSRVLWVYVDEIVSPGESSEAPYEKVRREQIERGQRH